MARKKRIDYMFLNIETDSICYNRFIEEVALDVLDPYQLLAGAIVCMAVDDYRYSIEMDNYVLKEQIENFFNSKWCELLTGGISPDFLIEGAHRDLKNKLSEEGSVSEQRTKKKND